jgi:uncharacterized membrane protein YccC
VSESDDLRTFIREILIRFERTVERLERTMERFARGMEEHREESSRYFEVIWAEQRLAREERKADREKLDEILAEGRAGRQALFKILDRMDGGGTASA